MTCAYTNSCQRQIAPFSKCLYLCWKFEGFLKCFKLATWDSAPWKKQRNKQREHALSFKEAIPRSATVQQAPQFTCTAPPYNALRVLFQQSVWTRGFTIQTEGGWNGVASFNHHQRPITRPDFKWDCKERWLVAQSKLGSWKWPQLYSATYRTRLKSNKPAQNHQRGFRLRPKQNARTIQNYIWRARMAWTKPVGVAAGFDWFDGHAGGTRSCNRRIYTTSGRVDSRELRKLACPVWGGLQRWASLGSCMWSGYQ